METNPLDPYTVTDIPYTPEILMDRYTKDKFSGYRALDTEDYNEWQKAIEEANS